MSTTRGAVRAPAGRRFVLVAAVALGVLVVLRTFVVGWHTVRADSMAPTVSDGDHVVVDRAGWRLDGLVRGDVVVLRSPADGTALVKRVVALAGDEVRIEDAVLVIDGEAVEEPYVDLEKVDGTFFGPVTVPAGHVFVLGDNRFGSVDSREFGPVRLDAVTGRVLLTLP
jgi:signal peptidase I